MSDSNLWKIVHVTRRVGAQSKHVISTLRHVYGEDFVKKMAKYNIDVEEFFKYVVYGGHNKLIMSMSAFDRLQELVNKYGDDLALVVEYDDMINSGNAKELLELPTYTFSGSDWGLDIPQWVIDCYYGSYFLKNKLTDNTCNIKHIGGMVFRGYMLREMPHVKEYLDSISGGELITREQFCQLIEYFIQMKSHTVPGTTTYISLLEQAGLVDWAGDPNIDPASVVVEDDDDEGPVDVWDY